MSKQSIPASGSTRTVKHNGLDVVQEFQVWELQIAFPKNTHRAVWDHMEPGSAFTLRFGGLDHEYTFISIRDEDNAYFLTVGAWMAEPSDWATFLDLHSVPSPGVSISSVAKDESTVFSFHAGRFVQ